MIVWLTGELSTSIQESETTSSSTMERYRAAQRATIYQNLLEVEQNFRLSFTREEKPTSKFYVQRENIAGSK